MLIVTNFETFPERWRASGGEEGRSVRARCWREFLRAGSDPAAVFVVNCNPALVLQLAACSRVLPFRRRPLVAVDLVLRRPRGVAAAAAAALKRILFGRVDHFIHYFRDLRGYQEVYGIGPERSSFVPFKPNLRYRLQTETRSDGDYVLCLGRSQRDYDTFFAAMQKLPYPGAIAQPDAAELAAHGAKFASAAPPHIQALADDGGEESQARLLEGARLVVIPILKSNMAASGISTALNAMLLGKCVIASEGPGVSDVFSDELLTVPPEDAAALAAMIERAWNDDALREKTAAGHRYAMSLGGEPELYQRIIDRLVAWRRGRL